MGRGLPLSRKFMNFSSQNGVIWCILGVLLLSFKGCCVQLLNKKPLADLRGQGGRAPQDARGDPSTAKSRQLLGDFVPQTLYRGSAPGFRVATPATPAALTPMEPNSGTVQSRTPHDEHSPTC